MLRKASKCSHESFCTHKPLLPSNTKDVSEVWLVFPHSCEDVCSCSELIGCQLAIISCGHTLQAVMQQFCDRVGLSSSVDLGQRWAAGSQSVCLSVRLCVCALQILTHQGEFFSVCGNSCGIFFSDWWCHSDVIQSYLGFGFERNV